MKRTKPKIVAREGVTSSPRALTEKERLIIVETNLDNFREEVRSDLAEVKTSITHIADQMLTKDDIGLVKQFIKNGNGNSKKKTMTKLAICFVISLIGGIIFLLLTSGGMFKLKHNDSSIEFNTNPNPKR